MHEINYIDKAFNPDASESYEVSIQANANGLAYCIADPSANSYLLFRKHPFDHVILAGDMIRKIRIVLENDEILSLKFHKVRFLGYTQQATLVPDDYFNKDEMTGYLHFNQGGEVDGELFNNAITPPGVHNIFALASDLVSLITLHFKKVEFMNQTTPFLKHLSNKPNPFVLPEVFLGLNPGFFDIACVGDGKLKLYNTFQYANENDLLYYTLFVFNQVGIDPQKTPLLVSGEFNTKLSYFEMLKQYIPETVFEKTCISALAPSLKSLETSQFLNLLNMQHCASLAEHIKEEK
jgi:hypothetical protein